MEEGCPPGIFMDFQLVLNVSNDHAKYLLNTLGIRVQKGERFKSGNLVAGLYENYSVRLDKYTETGRTVLCLIIPDECNHFSHCSLSNFPAIFILISTSHVHGIWMQRSRGHRMPYY